MNPAAAKAALRRRARAARRRLAPSTRRAAEAAIAGHLRSLAVSLGARVVATYAATTTEVDVSPFAAALLAGGGEALWPRVAGHGTLTWHSLAGPGGLRPGFRSILEPPLEAVACPLTEAVDLLLVPGVCFDRRGGRLGQGGGYYDRLLATVTRGHPLAVGIAFAAQVVPRVPTEPHDRPVALVVTERGFAAGGRWSPRPPSPRECLESLSTVC